MAHKLMLSHGWDYREYFLANIVLDPEFGMIENLGPTTLMGNPQLWKAKKTQDPDTPNFGAAMTGP